MKKGLLVAFGVSASLLAFAQSPQLVPHKVDLMLNSKSTADPAAPSFYSTAHGSQRNSNPTVQMTGTMFSSSRNAYTLLVSQSNCMTANQALGVAMFTHRISADWSPAGVNSGYIQNSWTVNDGTSWDSMYYDNDNVQLFRY